MCSANDAYLLVTARARPGSRTVARPWHRAGNNAVVLAADPRHLGFDVRGDDPEIQRQSFLTNVGNEEWCMSEHAVVIAGGGPTGMMLAAELTLAGTDVLIVERRASFRLESA